MGWGRVGYSVVLDETGSWGYKELFGGFCVGGAYLGVLLYLSPSS